jgi:hypothetical protein
MRRVHSSLVALAIVAAPALLSAQQQAGDANRVVAGGGIAVAGWQGKADGGAPISDAKLTKEADAFHVVTGPALAYWNPANVATGNYTVKATFKEPQYMNLNDHNHPYGIVIGGNDMGTDNQSYLYCAAYGNGTFIVRGFSSATNTFGVVDTGVVVGRSPRAKPDSAIHKASAKGEPVSQEIAISVKGDKVDCAINGKVVGSYDKAKLVGPGKLKSTDGVYGFRFAHNTEGFVSGLTMTKQ